GVIKHRRDASCAADFRALPGNDDQRRGRLLIAQDGHTQRLPSRDGGQLRIFVCLWLRILLFCLCLYLRLFSLFRRLFRLRFGRRFRSCFRFCLSFCGVWLHGLRFDCTSFFCPVTAFVFTLVL